MRLFLELQRKLPPIAMNDILEQIELKGEARECCRAVVLSTVATDARRPMYLRNGIAAQVDASSLQKQEQFEKQQQERARLEEDDE